jgi:hypothetical protein
VYLPGQIIPAQDHAIADLNVMGQELPHQAICGLATIETVWATDVRKSPLIVGVIIVTLGAVHMAGHHVIVIQIPVVVDV